MFRYSVVEWYDLQQRFIREPESISIRDYCFEATGDENLPLWEALDQKSREQEWDLLRDHFRLNQGEQVTIENSSAVKQALADIEKVNHPLRQIARTTEFCQKVLSKLEPAIETAFLALQSSSFALESPAEITRVLKDLASVYQMSNQLQRQSLGVKDPSELLQTVTASDNELTIAELDEKLRSLDDQEITLFLSELQKQKD